MADVGNRGDRPAHREEPALIELVMLDPGPRSNAASTAPSAPRRPRPRSRRRWPLVAVAAVLAVVIAATVARDDGSEGPPAALPASTLAPTTIAPTTIPATTIAPTTLAPTTVPSTVPATTAVGPSPSARVSLGPGPVLGTARGWMLASLDGSTLSLLDLDTGKTQRFTFDTAVVGASNESTIFFADRFVYTRHDGAPTVWSQRLVDKTPTIIVDDASIIAASANAGRFWVALNQGGPNGEQLVAEVDTGGRRYNVVTVPPGLQVMGSSAAGLWLYGSGRIFHLASGGALQAIAFGMIVDASGTGVLYDDCATAGPCTLRVANTPGSQTSSSNVGPSAELEIAYGWYRRDPAMSPNGRWLLLDQGVLDRRANNQIRRDKFLKSWRWSPDGEWLFAETEKDGTIAWNLADGREIALGDFALSGLVAVTK